MLCYTAPSSGCGGGQRQGTMGYGRKMIVSRFSRPLQYAGLSVVHSCCRESCRHLFVPTAPGSAAQTFILSLLLLLIHTVAALTQQNHTAHLIQILIILLSLQFICIILQFIYFSFLNRFLIDFKCVRAYIICILLFTLVILFQMTLQLLAFFQFKVHFNVLWYLKTHTRNF